MSMRFFINFCKRENVTYVLGKGQLVLKAIYGQLTSPKKGTDEFLLFAFLLFTANKSNSSVCFFGRIYGAPICLRKLTDL